MLLQVLLQWRLLFVLLCEYLNLVHLLVSYLAIVKDRSTVSEDSQSIYRLCQVSRTFPQCQHRSALKKKKKP